MFVTFCARPPSELLTDYRLCSMLSPPFRHSRLYISIISYLCTTRQHLSDRGNFHLITRSGFTFSWRGCPHPGPRTLVRTMQFVQSFCLSRFSPRFAMPLLNPNGTPSLTSRLRIVGSARMSLRAMASFCASGPLVLLSPTTEVTLDRRPFAPTEVQRADSQ